MRSFQLYSCKDINVTFLILSVKLPSKIFEGIN